LHGKHRFVAASSALKASPPSLRVADGVPVIPVQKRALSCKRMQAA
jgi:hypothetical protein